MRYGTFAVQSSRDTFGEIRFGMDAWRCWYLYLCRPILTFRNRDGPFGKGIFGKGSLEGFFWRTILLERSFWISKVSPGGASVRVLLKWYFGSDVELATVLL